MRRNKKKKGFILSGINIFFTILVFLELMVSAAVARFVQWLLEETFKTEVSDTWLLFMIVVLMGVALAFFVNRIFFRPIQKLNVGMNEIAAGDFSVRLKTKSPINEVKEIYGSFDLMVRELDATEVLQSDFVSNVSHEIKTPINAIEGYAMLLQDDQYTKEEQEEFVEKILFNTKRLSELVGNILLLSKIDNQAITKNEKSFRLDEQIRQSIMQLETKWTEKEIEFDVDLEKVEIVGNAQLLVHIWDNLIGNAIKFDPMYGMIKIRLSKEEGKIKFVIEDNGSGISDEALKHIFDKFYQGDSSHKAEGNGLGLALVKKIVDIYDGKIIAENLPEAGCRFTVELPAM